MNRGELVRKISDAESLPAATVDQLVGAVFEQIAEGLRAGEEVQIRGFGKFVPRDRAPVVRRNPKTGVEVKVPAKTSVGFVPSTKLKERLNGSDRKKGRRAGVRRRA